MSRLSLELLLRFVAVGGVMMALTAAPAPGQFSAGSTGGCTLKNETDYYKCNGVNGNICTHGVDRCTMGTTLSTCTEGNNGLNNCGSYSNCDSSSTLKFATTNATGCNPP